MLIASDDLMVSNPPLAGSDEHFSQLARCECCSQHPRRHGPNRSELHAVLSFGTCLGEVILQLSWLHPTTKLAKPQGRFVKLVLSSICVLPFRACTPSCSEFRRWPRTSRARTEWATPKEKVDDVKRSLRKNAAVVLACLSFRVCLVLCSGLSNSNALVTPCG